MMPEKARIQVYLNPRISGRQTPVEVEAWLVGGPEGVFAAWTDERGLVHMARGDDGTWFELTTYHPHWITDMISAMANAMNDAKKTGGAA